MAWIFALSRYGIAMVPPIFVPPEETGGGANRRIDCNTATGIVAMFHAAAFKIVPPLDNLPDNPGPALSKSLIDELNEAVSAGGTTQRLRILERITDLFAAGSRGYTGDQIALFDDVLGELAADIEVQARARLSRRLAHIDTSPPAIIRSLAFATLSLSPSRC
jgi:hypothetical protein